MYLQAPLATSAPPAKMRVQAILREATALPWLPMTSDDVARCARRVKVMLMQYQHELLPITLVAVAQALGHDAATKDVHLAQVRMHAVLAVSPLQRIRFHACLST